MKYIFTAILVMLMPVFSFCQDQSEPYAGNKTNLHYHSFAEKHYYVMSVIGAVRNGTAKQTIDTFTALEINAARAGDIELAAELKLKTYFSALYLNSPAYDSVEYGIKKIAAEAIKNNMHYVEADALQMLADYNFEKKHQRSLGMEYCLAAYDVYKNFNGDEFPQKQYYTYVLGGLFYSLEDYDIALKYLTEALHDKPSKQKNIDCPLNNIIGLCYRNQKKYDSAISYFKQSYELATNNENVAYKGIATGNIGITYFLQKKYDEAIPLLKKDIESGVANTQLKNAARSMAILATIYNNKHEYDKAESLLLAALQVCENKTFWPEYTIAEPIYKQLYVVYAARKDFHRAYLYADSALIAKDSATSLNSTLTLAMAHDKMEYAQHKMEADQLQNQIKIAHLQISKNRLTITLSVMAVVILLIAVLFISRLNRQVTAQKKELEQVNSVKDRIFSVISHDLRTPVNSLVSFTQLLEHGNIPPEKMQKYAAVLKDNLGYTASLMENLLNWARTQMQGYKPVFEKFDVAETVHQTINLLNQEALNKGLSVLDTTKPGTMVFADINMTAMIVRNLVSNAIKYTPRGGTVTFTAGQTADKVFLKVTDSGVGIAGELVNKFNNSQSDQTLDSTYGTNKEKGTGLGLMLCKGFAGLMHGRITLESEKGKGSTFTVELPA